MDYQKLLLDFETQLDHLEKGNGDILLKAETGMGIVEECLVRLRTTVSGKTFGSKAEEIHFFKHVKPQISSKLIYYGKLFDIESKRPRSSHANQIKYYKKQMKRFKNFFNYNTEFFNYYRRGAMSKDEKYFIRGKYDLCFPVDNYQFITDKEFSTSQDATVAIIMAYDMLIVYLQQMIDQLKDTLEPPKHEPMEKTPQLFWTGTKTDLIELMYALHASGFVNSGTIEIKELAGIFETFFNVNLGHYYHTFIEIRARKTSRTRCLDHLSQRLVQRMESKEKE